MENWIIKVILIVNFTQKIDHWYSLTAIWKWTFIIKTENWIFFLRLQVKALKVQGGLKSIAKEIILEIEGSIW